MNCSPPGSVHGIPRPEYWSGLPFPSPGDLSDPGIEPTSPSLAGGFFTAEPLRSPVMCIQKKAFCNRASSLLGMTEVKDS